MTDTVTRPVAVGDPLPALRVGEITAARMVAVMGVMGDTNPIHEDEALAKQLGFRGLVNQGPANLSYVANMLLAWASDPASIRRLRFRFLDNVVPGDDLEATARVTAVEPDGAVVCAFELRSPGRLHLTGEATLLVHRA
jgi:acyl dehydratase